MRAEGRIDGQPDINLIVTVHNSAKVPKSYECTRISLFSPGLLECGIFAEKGEKC